MAHTRRPFAKLVKIAKKAGKAHQILSMITKLYQIEQEARNKQLSPDKRYQLRLEKAEPILNKIKQWLDRFINAVPPSSTIGKGISYMLNRWGELTAYLKDGRLEIDNNWVENNIRPFAISRKN
jgi:transposase